MAQFATGLQLRKRKSTAEGTFAYNYSQDGKVDSIRTYCPSHSSPSLCPQPKQTNASFSPVSRGCELSKTIGDHISQGRRSRAFEFDDDHTRNSHHVALYHPGDGVSFITS